MKVGMIGLGRMGEGMSRRMMKGIEVIGYRRNYLKTLECRSKNYITDAAETLEELVGKLHHGDRPGIFQLVIPAELVEETIDALLLAGCGQGDIIIDHGNSNF